VIYRSLLYGSGIYLRPDFEAEPIRKLLHENRSVMVASMVPTMLVELLEESFFRAHFDFKAILLGGGPISLELINRSITRGLPIVCSYGMTETCAQIAANPMLQPSGIYIPKNSVGPIFEPNRIQIRSDDGDVLPSNESGKIWLKGPQIFDGYLDEELTQMAFDDDGWFHTGDYGHLNRRGHLFIETRRSDLIITGGENVNPTVVEEQLRSLETVIEAGVVGIPDKKWGQRVVAFITTSTREQPDEDQLKEALKSYLRSFMIPKEFILIDEIPKTPNGKIQRNELVQIYQIRR
jgi:O-succinylbenzoic acid--CoA ligase